MTKSLEEIRRKLQAMKYTPDTGVKKRSDKSIYPHWNIPEGSTATLRFLPDANEENTFFWAEKQIFKFPFPGIKGHDENKEVIVQAPCIEMWDPKSCPVLNEIRPWWKANDKELEETASKYWVKRTYYFQGFVVKDPMNEDDPPENPIRKFILTPQLFKIIYASLFDVEEMKNSPVDYVNGTNFIVSKSSSGGHASYTTSKWARNESSLTEEMVQAIETYGLVDLSTYLPKKPDSEHLAAIYEMFQASLAGELYDPERWGFFYKPYGMDTQTDSSDDDTQASKVTTKLSVSKPVSNPVLKKQAVVESDDGDDEQLEKSPVVSKKTEETSASSKTPQEILAMLRNRNK